MQEVEIVDGVVEAEDMQDLNRTLQAIVDGHTSNALYAGDAIYRIYSMTKPVRSFMALNAG